MNRPHCFGIVEEESDEGDGDGEPSGGETIANDRKELETEVGVVASVADVDDVATASILCCCCCCCCCSS